MAEVTALYRYPVKGLSAEPLPALTLARASGLAFDREYALALGTTAFDPQKPEPLDKGYFLMLRSNEVLAALATRFDPETGQLTITRDGATMLTEDLTRPEGRAAVERFFEAYIGPAAKGRPRLVRAADHKFTDGSVISPAFMRAVSLINLASVRALEERTGRAIHPLRFRASIYVDGLEPWAEMDWVGREVTVGGLRLRGLARTPRCAAVDVNPATARRDTHLPKALKRHFDHVDLGIYLEVLTDGTVSLGDRLMVMPQTEDAA
ncbi:sulfurase [Methylobacterium sp. Leaf123]|uniref:MOSC domain-containing protein n=1 Tax=Methylobacterium sp. Leaf123 TaxID=1736264 RepID=UPI0006FB6B51|nr:MOSC domain-containing protein [Methylobacterium sp. Leaf123]KQQ31278.1 sulfurase [Methylobacterium sp. Leaf123]